MLPIFASCLGSILAIENQRFTMLRFYYATNVLIIFYGNNGEDYMMLFKLNILCSSPCVFYRGNQTLQVCVCLPSQDMSLSLRDDLQSGAWEFIQTHTMIHQNIYSQI